MTSKYMKLDGKPGLNHPGNPNCDACWVEVEHDGDGWVCPSCGTSWPSDRLEADPEDAMLYEEWAGEEIEGTAVPVGEAHRFSHFSDPTDRERAIEEFLSYEGGAQ